MPTVERRCLNILFGLGGGTEEEGVEKEGTAAAVEIGGGVETAVGEGGPDASRRSDVVPLLSIGFRFVLVGAKHLTTTE